MYSGLFDDVYLFYILDSWDNIKICIIKSR